MPNLDDKKSWLDYVRLHQGKLYDFVWNYHPSENVGSISEDEWLTITAPAAEEACAVVRKKIAEDSVGKPRAKDRFVKAVEAEDVGEIYSLLQSAWFGVPESTSCWGVEGFKEAVDLLDYPPMPDWEEE